MKQFFQNVINIIRFKFSKKPKEVCHYSYIAAASLSRQTSGCRLNNYKIEAAEKP